MKIIQYFFIINFLINQNNFICHCELSGKISIKILNSEEKFDVFFLKFITENYEILYFSNITPKYISFICQKFGYDSLLPIYSSTTESIISNCVEFLFINNKATNPTL